MRRGHLFWLLIFAAAILLSGGVWLWMGLQAPERAVALVYQDSALVGVFDLSAVDEPERITVETPEGGHNTLLLEQGRISVCEADCPDQICVHQGATETAAMPIVCLPNRLMIRIEGAEGAVDAVVGGAG